MSYDLKGKRIWVAGHRGMVGGAVARRLAVEGCEVITAGRDVVDLVDQAQVRSWMAANRPDAIVLAAAKVGGIKANNDFETDEYGNIIYDVTAVRNGSQVDSTTFLRWYQALTGLLPAGRLPDGWTPQSEAQARIVIVNAAGDLTREIVFYPYNQVYQAVALDGVCLYYFRNTWYEQLGELP